MNPTVIPLWKQRKFNFESYSACTGTWSEWSGIQRPYLGSTLNGEEFSRDALAPHQGDHINAMPYWSKSLDVQAIGWNAQLETRHPGGCPQYQYAGDGRTFTGISASEVRYVPPSAETQAFVKRLAVMKAQASLRKADASIPMMLRERAATLAMMKSYAGRGLDLVHRRQSKDVERWRRLSKKMPSDARKFLAQTIANEHLMFVFGMLPLLQDLEGLAEHVMRDEHKFIVGRGRHATMSESKDVIDQSAWGFMTVRKTQQQFSVRCNLRADIEFQVLGAAQKLGFNPLYSLYDFTPLSFVTGWFSNFNFWIQSLDPLYGSTFRTGSVSIRRKTVVTKDCYAVPTDRYRSKGGGDSKGINTHDVREVMSSMPPQGSIEFYNNFSFFSVAASASLFVQRKVKLANKAIAVKPFRYRSKKPVNLPPIKYTRSL